MVLGPAAHMNLGQSAWHVEPFVLGLVLGGVAMYALVVEAAWRDGRRKTIISRTHLVSFLLGITVLAMALLSPIATAAATSLSAHMLQHVLLVGLAAPLLAFGLPLARLPALMPASWRQRGAAISWPSMVVAVAAVVVVHTVAVWAWHVPALYEAALTGAVAHSAEHGMFLVTAMLVWWVVLGFGVATRPSLAPVLGLLFVAAQGALLGALMAFSGFPWYETYASPAALADGSAVADQQLAGLLMWGYGGLTAIVCGALFIPRWFARLDRYPATVEPATPSVNRT